MNNLRTERGAVIRGSRLFNTIFGLARTGKKYHEILEGCSKAARLQFGRSPDRYALKVNDPFRVSQILERISKETLTGGWLASIFVTTPAK